MNPDNYLGAVRVREGISRQYVTGDNLFAERTPVFLPEETYRQAISALVFACVDLFVVNPRTGQVLLGKRQQEPQPDWWVIGGRMRPGESFEQAGIRAARRELDLALDDSSFRLLGNYSYVWDTSAQGGPCHSIGFTLVVELTKEQIEAISYNEEYADTQWVDPMDIVKAADGTYHPALVQMFVDYDVLKHQ